MPATGRLAKARSDRTRPSPGIRLIRAALQSEGGNPPGADSAVGALLRALAFAADKHRDQRRKGAGAPPFINHAIEVAALLNRVARVEDPITLQAAVLHDTLEDTDVTFAELVHEFGSPVAQVVREVSDENGLSRSERKRRQIEAAPHLSERAGLVRIADKIANVRAITFGPPIDWSLERRLDYLHWTKQVVGGCRGYNDPLDALYDESLQEGLRIVTLEAAGK
ncbi:MAG: HD domain-containing protein [Gemmatimonas sp.]|nr:HD domain-containing protein [Gemmatimonas sp.]